MQTTPKTAERRSRLEAMLKAFVPRSRSWVVFLLVMVCYKIVLNRIATALTILAIYPADGSLPSGLPPLQAITPMLFISGLLLGPVFESLVIIGVIEGLRKLHLALALRVGIALFVICGLHSIPYFISGLLAAPLFLIDCGTYVYWRRVSFKCGAGMMIALHILYNAYSILHTASYRAVL